MPLTHRKNRCFSAISLLHLNNTGTLDVGTTAPQYCQATSARVRCGYAYLDSVEIIRFAGCSNYSIQSKILCQAPANGRNQGKPLYNPRGAKGKGSRLKGCSLMVPCSIASATVLPR